MARSWTSRYDDWILAPVIARSLATRHCHTHRSHVVPAARGEVVELGFGAGTNLAHYREDRVTRVHAVEPSSGARRLAARRVAASPIPVTFDALDGQALPYEDKSFDTCVLTWTLCSIPDPERALAEVRRVLRPDGQLLFLEHGEHPDADIAARQRRLEPVWRRIAGGCHLTRRADELVHNAGFELISNARHTMPGPKFATYLYEGSARPA